MHSFHYCCCKCGLERKRIDWLMMDQGNIGSPDSGIGTLSPCLSVSSGSEVSETKNLYFTFDSKMTSMPNCEEPKSPNLLADQSSTSFYEEKLGPKMTDDSNRRCSRKTNIRRSKSKKKQSLNDDLSPVLGVRILPATQFQSRNSENKSKISREVENKKVCETDFICRLCYQPHDDAVALAAHKCARIINESYPCPECGKIFGCSANLASHRRWHKPKEIVNQMVALTRSDIEKLDTKENPLLPFVNLKRKNEDKKTEQEDIMGSSQRYKKAIYPCPYCKRRFRRTSNRRKHVQVKHGIKMEDVKPAEAAKKNLDKKNKFYNENRETALETIVMPLPQTSRIVFSQSSPMPIDKLPIIYESQKRFTNCSLSSQTVATETVLDLSTTTRNWRTNGNSTPDEPLDLSVKKRRKDEINHSIAKIMESQPIEKSSVPFTTVTNNQLPNLNEINTITTNCAVTNSVSCYVPITASYSNLSAANHELLFPYWHVFPEALEPLKKF